MTYLTWKILCLVCIVDILVILARPCDIVQVVLLFQIKMSKPVPAGDVDEGEGDEGHGDVDGAHAQCGLCWATFTYDILHNYSLDGPLVFI